MTSRTAVVKPDLALNGDCEGQTRVEVLTTLPFTFSACLGAGLVAQPLCYRDPTSALWRILGGS